ncbi:hypothetical protein ACFUCV_10715 [Specibacter sp. NPDC057265]|uniref:hypothetical protein n=1 Tax=Specibacter sp. NPDC057265 TaxID=3346075 RepID=UPI0036341CB4
MKAESAQAAPASFEGAGIAAASSDARVNALLQAAAGIESLPVGERNRHYGQVLSELTAELTADPGTTVAHSGTDRPQP